ncbi:MAG TPA: hypothetical protein VGZ93_03140 [Candidatus Methylacidiphilales bacterium]|jgi:hypothetical protein|nr:hypothetical protein [Candidatus Methylacidiphilales bacterium]
MKTLLSKLTSLFGFKKAPDETKKNLLIIHYRKGELENVYAPPGSNLLVVILNEHQIWDEYGYNQEQMAAYVDTKTKGMEALEVFGRDVPPSFDSN